MLPTFFCLFLHGKHHEKGVYGETPSCPVWGQEIEDDRLGDDDGASKFDS